MISLLYKIFGPLTLSLFLASPAYCDVKETWKVTLNKEITHECEKNSESFLRTRKITLYKNGSLVKLNYGNGTFMFGETSQTGFQVSVWNQRRLDEVSKKSGSSYIFSFKPGEKRANVIFKSFSKLELGDQSTDESYCEYSGDAELL